MDEYGWLQIVIFFILISSFFVYYFVKVVKVFFGINEQKSLFRNIKVLAERTISAAPQVGWSLLHRAAGAGGILCYYSDYYPISGPLDCRRPSTERPQAKGAGQA